MDTKTIERKCYKSYFLFFRDRQVLNLVFLSNLVFFHLLKSLQSSTHHNIKILKILEYCLVIKICNLLLVFKRFASLNFTGSFHFSIVPFCCKYPVTFNIRLLSNFTSIIMTIVFRCSINETSTCFIRYKYNNFL